MVPAVSKHIVKVIVSAGLRDALGPSWHNVPVSLQLNLSPSYYSTDWQTSPVFYCLLVVSMSSAMLSH